MWTDGSVLTNPGQGGWAAVIVYNGSAKIVGGCSAQTTNNRMETEAIIGGLNALKKPCAVTVITDSNYVYFGLRRILQGRMPKSNPDVWARVQQAIQGHRLQVEKTTGHADDSFNNLADVYAGLCAARQIAMNEFHADVARLVERRNRRRVR
jgi:ribonuclease HI